MYPEDLGKTLTFDIIIYTKRLSEVCGNEKDL